MTKSMSWRFRLWLAAPILKALEFYMAKDKDAVAQLKALLDSQGDAITAVENNVSSDEETDWAAIQPLVQQAAQNNSRLARLAGVRDNGTNTAEPTNPQTGLPASGEELGSGSNVSVNDPQANTSGNETVTESPVAESDASNASNT